MIQTRLLDLLRAYRFGALVQKRLALTLLVSLVVWGAAWASKSNRKSSVGLWVAGICLPFFLIASFAQIERLPPMGPWAVKGLTAWAAANTPATAVFLFPDAGVRHFYPGVFRTEAQRAVYVDWKGGGQVVQNRTFAHEWWRRWWATMDPPSGFAQRERLLALGIGYVVVQKSHAWPMNPVFEDSQFAVYRLQPGN